MTIALPGCGGVSPSADDAKGTAQVQTVDPADAQVAAEASAGPSSPPEAGVDLVAVDADAASPDVASPDVASPDAAAEVVDAGVDAAPPVDAPVESSALDAATDAVAEAPARSCGLKINELQTGGQSATDEFVELFNPCADQPASLAGYKLVYRSDVGTSDVLRVAFTTEGFAEGRPFVVCANVAFAGQADARFTDGLKAEGGALALRGPDGKIVDSVGWGTATNAFVEHAAAPAPLPGQSIARSPDGRDTDDNATDFVVRGPATSPGASNGH